VRRRLIGHEHYQAREDIIGIGAICGGGGMCFNHHVPEENFEPTGAV
jgi:hypothetical protein